MGAKVEEDGCCTYFGRNFLIGINLLSAVLGLLLCAGGAYVWVEYENQFQEVLSPAPVLGVLIAGFVLFVFTMVGIYGAVTGKKPVLVLYLVVVVVLIAAEVVASVLFLQYLDVIGSSAGASSSELRDQTEIAINNFIYRTYDTCCVNEPRNCAAYEFDTSPDYCEPVGFCASANATSMEACIVDDAQESMEVELGICSALENLRFDNQPLVGMAEAGNDVSCGGGSPEAFEAAVTDWLQANIRFFGYGALGLGIVLVLIVGFSVGLVLARPHLVPQAEYLDDAESETIDPNRLSMAIPINPRYSSNRYSAQRSSVDRSTVASRSSSRR